MAQKHRQWYWSNYLRRFPRIADPAWPVPYRRLRCGRCAWRWISAGRRFPFAKGSFTFRQITINFPWQCCCLRYIYRIRNKDPLIPRCCNSTWYLFSIGISPRSDYLAFLRIGICRFIFPHSEHSPLGCYQRSLFSHSCVTFWSPTHSGSSSPHLRISSP